jgi:hypothetical protein
LVSIGTIGLGIRIRESRRGQHERSEIVSQGTEALSKAAAKEEEVFKSNFKEAAEMLYTQSGLAKVMV